MEWLILLDFRTHDREGLTQPGQRYPRRQCDACQTNADNSAELLASDEDSDKKLQDHVGRNAKGNGLSGDSACHLDLCIFRHRYNQCIDICKSQNPCEYKYPGLPPNILSPAYAEQNKLK